MNPKPDFESPGIALKMKAPFPYFGAKTRAAETAWAMLGTVANYVEPFAGSLGVMLNRPAPFSGVETVNDLDCLLVNAWRAIQLAPDELAPLCVAPVAEVNTESQHAALIAAKDGVRDRLGDPAYYDATLAAWWIKGANEWIGSGWCAAEGPWQWSAEDGWQASGGGTKRKLPHLGDAGKGVNRQLPHLGDAGKGVNRQLPHLGDAGTGVNRKLPHLGNAGTGAYGQRVESVTGWLCALRDRLCSVRIACGDWRRVLGESVTTKHFLTAVFLDPPYEGTEYVYGTDHPVSQDVREWCIANGANRLLRIILAGRGEEHDALLAHGWRKETWSALKGYASHEERLTEALWCSPACIPLEKERDLFDLTPTAE